MSTGWSAPVHRGPRDDFGARLAELVAGSVHQLVSAGDRNHVEERHILECEELAERMGPLRGRWLDLGTGGGLPGLVLAHRHPAADWVLVDATAKKVEEVRRFAEVLGVRCHVVQGRAEELAREVAWRGKFEGVVARAVAPLPTLVELARGFLPEGGVLVALKGAQWEREVNDSDAALARTRMRIDAVESSGTGGGSVIWVRAEGSVPERVPRRTGVPARRPL